jgi:hypothetical protein
MQMSQREALEQVRKLRADGSPDFQVVAQAIGTIEEQMARMSSEMTKLKNDMQQLKNARAKTY